MPEVTLRPTILSVGMIVALVIVLVPGRAAAQSTNGTGPTPVILEKDGANTSFASAEIRPSR